MSESTPALLVVIHAEEEFNWDAGFYRSNVGVSYADNLIKAMTFIIELGGKVTLAMDYPFVTSQGGKRVIEHFKHHPHVEFATHLHPWVNPPFENDDDCVLIQWSYPGNLPEELEYQKIKTLTEAIESTAGVRPKTYLAGRYGAGPNTAKILKSLGYHVDLSISAYSDFRFQEGPDFSQYASKKFRENQITYLPHTCSILSVLPPIANYFNRHPTCFTQVQSHQLSRLIAKVLRVKKFRLSPEGFTFKDMKQITKAQLDVGHRELIMSFHSPSTQAGHTPYVQTDTQLQQFLATIQQYIEWFKQDLNGQLLLPSNLTVDEA